MSGPLMVSAMDVEKGSFEIVTLLDIAFDLIEENTQIHVTDKERVLTLLNVIHERGVALQELPSVAGAVR